MGSSQVHETILSNDLNRKIASYSDFRVGPHGVVSINERYDDVLKRYKNRNHVLSNSEKTELKRTNSLILEKQIQDFCLMDLNRIDDESISTIITELQDLEINT